MPGVSARRTTFAAMKMNAYRTIIVAGALVLFAAACGPARKPDQGSAAPESPKDEFAGPVAIRASNGKYICADQAEGIARWGELKANRDSIGDWESFELVKQDSLYYALRTKDGKYASAEREGTFQVVADRDSVGDWERFEILKLANGRVAFRTTEGRYLASELAEGASCPLCILANRTDQGEWESFELQRLELLP